MIGVYGMGNRGHHRPHAYPRRRGHPTHWEPCIAYSPKGRDMMPPSRDTAGQGQESTSSPNQGCPCATTTVHTPGCILCCGQLQLVPTHPKCTGTMPGVQGKPQNSAVTPEPQCGARLGLSGQSTHLECPKPLCHIPSTREAGAGGLGVQGQPLLHKEFEEQKRTQCPPWKGQEWALKGMVSPESSWILNGKGGSKVRPDMWDFCVIT